MIEEGLTPGQARRRQEGQPKKNIVSERTLRRWLNHYKWWGETPRRTRQRLRMKNFKCGENKMTRPNTQAPPSLSHTNSAEQDDTP